MPKAPVVASTGSSYIPVCPRSPVPGPVPVPVQTGEWKSEFSLLDPILKILSIYDPWRYITREAVIDWGNPHNWMPSEYPGLSYGDAKKIKEYQEWEKENKGEPC